jgi:hypothetical protein
MVYPEAHSGDMVVGGADPHGKTAHPVHPNLNPMFPSLGVKSDFLPSSKFGYLGLVDIDH